MFPTVRCSFTNLRPDQRYWVLLDIVPCDNKRYRYAYHRSSWLVAGKADPPPPHRLYPHPDAPYTGEQLRKQVVSFEKVKLTNNEMDKNGQVRKCSNYSMIYFYPVDLGKFPTVPPKEGDGKDNYLGNERVPGWQLFCCALRKHFGKIYHSRGNMTFLLLL